MSVIDQEGPSNWKDVVKDMNGEEFKRDPIAFLAHKQVKINSTLQEQEDRLKNLEGNEQRIKMWNALKALVEDQLPPEERWKIICKLAETYQGFLGWEGETNDEPGW